MSFAVIVALVLTGFVALFSLQNAQPVQVSFINWYFQGSLVVVLLLAFGAGLASGALLSVPGRFKKSRELADCRKQLKASEKNRSAREPQGGQPQADGKPE